jgi:hypothetical protein
MRCSAADGHLATEESDTPQIHSSICSTAGLLLLLLLLLPLVVLQAAATHLSSICYCCTCPVHSFEQHPSQVWVLGWELQPAQQGP